MLIETWIPQLILLQKSELILFLETNITNYDWSNCNRQSVQSQNTSYGLGGSLRSDNFENDWTEHRTEATVEQTDDKGQHNYHGIGMTLEFDNNNN